MERIEREQADYLFIILIILLTGIGMSILFSASYYHSEKLGRGPLSLFNKQLVFVALGFLGLIVCTRLPVAVLQRAVPVLVIVTLALALLPFIPGIGREINGAKRWISLFDYTFQPSELIKFTIVAYLAAILAKKEHRLDKPLQSLAAPFAVVFVFALIIFFQNDLSTALFIIVIALSMCFIARVKIIFFLVVGIALVLLAGLAVLLKPYWIDKIVTFFYPLSDPYNAGYQVEQSKIALQSGGFLGRGVGMSLQKFNLPEADSDFIFPVAGEELGFVGVFFLIVLFALFALRGYSIAFKSKDGFSFYLGFGLTTTIFLQALLNMLVAAGLAPATGMPLPFFSLGGSAMLMTLVMCGLLINISRNKGNGGGYFNE